MADPTVIDLGSRDRRPRPLLRTVLGDVLRRTRREQGRTLADVADADVSGAVSPAASAGAAAASGTAPSPAASTGYDAGALAAFT